MGIQLTIGGTDFTDYVVSSERSHNICNPLSSLDIELSPDLPRDIETYESVVFYENGTKVFTGYTDGYIKAHGAVHSVVVHPVTVPYALGLAASITFNTTVFTCKSSDPST